MGRRRVIVVSVVVGLVIGAGVAGGVAEASGSPKIAPAGSTSGVTTATVVETNLVSTVQVGGSIGYSGSYEIVAPGGVSAQQVTQDQQQVSQAEQTEAADQTAQADDAKSSAQSIDSAQSSLTASEQTLATDGASETAACAGRGSSTPACTQATQKVAQDQTAVNQGQAGLASAEDSATRANDQDSAKLQADAMQLSNAEATLATAEETAVNPGTTYTQLPAVGHVISRGQALYALDGEPVPLLYGSEPAWRSLEFGMPDGSDVGELTQNLIAMGYGAGLTQSDHFSAATGAAVEKWQAALGLPQTGALLLGEVVFEPGAIRVTSVTPSVGSTVGPGTILDATSTARVVTVDLDVTQENLVKEGDPVTVVLPDGTDTPGHVQNVSNVAVCPGGGDDGAGNGASDSGGAEPSSDCSSSSGSSSPTVTVIISLDDPAASGSLDQAPVNVNVTSQAVDHVLALPIDALLALEEGGYGVEVVEGGSHQLVAVQTGLFSDTMVQVSGAGITAGTVVEVPST